MSMLHLSAVLDIQAAHCRSTTLTMKQCFLLGQSLDPKPKACSSKDSPRLLLKAAATVEEVKNDAMNMTKVTSTSDKGFIIKIVNGQVTISDE